jgi:hypothetical protein
MVDLPRPVTIADKYLAVLVANQAKEIEALNAILDALATYEPPAEEDTVELKEGEPELTPLPEDFPGYDALVKEGIIYLETVPRKGEVLVAIPGIGAATANKILTWLRV